MKNKKWIFLSILILLVFAAYFYHQLTQISPKRTLAEAIQIYGPQAEQRLRPFFERAAVSYPPAKLLLIGLKEDKQLELWAYTGVQWKYIRSYNVQKASGVAGPKLREGDYQVPEGFYSIEGLNPNSKFHLSMKINYPNAFDQKQAASEGRTRLGNDIFIHGKASSVGCLAMGDSAIEELFVLVAKVGHENVNVVLVPRDFRRRKLDATDLQQPAWLLDLYHKLELFLMDFTRTPPGTRSTM